MVLLSIILNLYPAAHMIFKEEILMLQHKLSLAITALLLTGENPGV
jgi:hypothetical protein